MKKVLIVTNQPAPYRVDFFAYLQKHFSQEYTFYILFSTTNRKTLRSWHAGTEKLKNTVFLKSKIVRLKKELDVREIIISYGASRALSEIRPDVIVCSEYNSTSLIVKHYSRTHGIPFISWSDGTRFSERNISGLQKLFRKYIVRGSSAFIASSTKTKENQIYLGARAEQVYISELSIDRDRFIQNGTNKRDSIVSHISGQNRIIYVGSLIPRKGVDLLLQAVKLLEDVAWELYLVGDGSERQALSLMAQELGISERVHFTGFLEGDALTELYAESAFFILPTREDCFGLVTLEAMNCGLPVISSKYADSAYDLIEEDVNGFIVDPYDPEMMASRMRELLSDPALRRRMGDESLRIAEKFDFRHTAAAFMRAIRDTFDKTYGKTDVLYASFQCSEHMFSVLFGSSEKKPGQAVQKYNRLLSEGLAASERVSLTALSELPITEQNYRPFFWKRKTEKVHQVNYVYIPLINRHGWKDIFAFFTSFRYCLALMRKKKTAVIADILNAPVALGSYFASRLGKCPYIAVVTDLPEYVYSEHDRKYRAVSRFLLMHADRYVFLTEQMNDRYNKGKRPYIVIEGMADSRENRKAPVASKGNTKKIVYTGSVDRIYGIGNLTEGFLQAKLADTELHIYGDGDMRESLERTMREHPQIIYHGSVLIEEAIKAQREADLLVNPRPTADDYTKYSFPSKTMEYLASGTPVLMTGLPGMPKEYKEHIYLIRKEDASGIADALQAVFAEGPKAMAEKGAQARRFVLQGKNNIVQAERLIRELGL
ncbi:MAG: glycosyltransferase [Lachnospiraceae bacterium]|nr:glycosyltransferase [Lachnospiraceae bacterium]